MPGYLYFDSKNMLSKVVNSTIINLDPQENFVVYESRPDVIGGNISGHVLSYYTIIWDG
jgi:hypothetical protein